MKAKSKGSSAGSARRVSSAGPSRRSIRSASPASLEVAARDRRPLLAHVAGDEHAVVGQAAGDADRRVAGEGAELERPAGADRPHQQGHHRPLLGRDLHHRDLAHLARSPPRAAAAARPGARCARPRSACSSASAAVNLSGIVSARYWPVAAWRDEPAASPTRAPASPAHDWPGRRRPAAAGAPRRRRRRRSSRSPRRSLARSARRGSRARRRARRARSRCRRPQRVAVAEGLVEPVGAPASRAPRRRAAGSASATMPRRRSRPGAKSASATATTNR